MTKTISSREKLIPQTEMFDESILVREPSDENHQNVEKEEAQEQVQALGVDLQELEMQEAILQIVHVTTGRVRIRATNGNGKEFPSQKFIDIICDRLQQQEGIQQTNWHEQTQNLVIAFDHKILSISQILAILAEFGVKEQKMSEKQPSDPFAAWKSVEFWQEQGLDLIPLFAGLAITSRLGIGGLASIPIYMLTADVTRRIIAQIQKASCSKAEKLKSTKQAQKARSGSDQTKNSPTSQQVQRKKKTANNNSSSQNLVSKVEKVSTIEREINCKIEREDKINAVSQVSGLKPQPTKINYSIVHSIPGRIRFHIPRLTKDKAYARRLERLLKTEAHVNNVRVNCDAASVAIAFQPHSLNSSHWISFLELADEVIPETTTINITQLNTQLNTTVNTVIEPPSQLLQVDTSNQEVTTVNGIIADLKPPFINLLVDVVAKFPIA
ncbi:HMA2 domain-containing protein [Calothrix sp. UHCC 0171]|uniref:HMA2 domain-containing protein n=1 Tax=Calothrix sp. UHCC 0171 TaxID=3110245 RepID=UPI002B1FF130|nr:hypothetical protein [Calothrix sp. UHCC 0171]MEA5572080.1 hypothetical protein [Calothrix sp. UHCC 0171]